MKSENLNFLEPSGPLQDCNGNTLPYSFNTENMKMTNLLFPPYDFLSSWVKELTLYHWTACLFRFSISVTETDILSIFLTLTYHYLEEITFHEYCAIHNRSKGTQSIHKNTYVYNMTCSEYEYCLNYSQKKAEAYIEI